MKTSIALIFAVSTLFLAGCCTTHREHASKWEYQKVWDFKMVQKLSAEGWTLDGFHSFDPGDSGTYYILRRRVRSTASGSGASDSATHTGKMLITHAGAYTSPGGKWRVEVRLDDGTLHVSHVRSTVSSTISVGGWTAQTGWFAFVESDARVWAFDGGRNLSLTTHKSNTPASDTLISYGPNRFPCQVPSEVASRLPETFRQTIVSNE